VPTSGKSAIEVEQPPSASAATSTAPKANALLFRSIDIRPEIPDRWYEPCSDTTIRSSGLAAALKSLSPETIKAETTNRTVGASI
jgi:hypothetical protein